MIKSNHLMVQMQRKISGHARASGPEPRRADSSHRCLTRSSHSLYCVTGDDPWPEVLTRLLQSNRKSIQMTLPANLEHAISRASTGPISIVPGCPCERSRQISRAPSEKDLCVCEQLVGAFLENPCDVSCIGSGITRMPWALNYIT
jgi:hypothetical protein